MPPRKKPQPPKKTKHYHEVDDDQNEFLARIDERLESLKETQVQILTQVKTTNGRVTSLERWRAYLIGGGVVIVTILGWLANSIK